MRAMVAAFIASSIASAGLVVWELCKRGLPRFERYASIATIVFVCWCVVALLVLVDIQIGDRLYVSATSFDHCIRASFVRTAANSVPPTNPFFYPGHTVPLRYYYFWNTLCAIPMLLTGVGPRFALYGSIVWTGIALCAIVALYMKYFAGATEDHRRRAMLGIALLGVTGLDLIPILVVLISPPHQVFPDMEWWEPEIVTSWMDSILWVPNHVTALIALLTGFLLLWTAGELGRRARWVAIIVAAVAFATAAGYSIYVTFAFVIFVFAWIAWNLIQQRWAEAWRFLIAGFISLLIARPYLHELQGPAFGGPFAVFGIRLFPELLTLFNQMGWHSRLVYAFTKLLLAPLSYFLEFGFFFLITILRWRTDKPWRFTNLTRPQQAAWLLLLCSIGITTFLRSSVIANNDLGYRAVLLAQFVLLLWAVPVVESRFTTDSKILSRSVLIGMFVLGAVASVYQLGMLRSFAMLSDADRADVVFWLAQPGDIGTTTMSYRNAYRALEPKIPTTAVVQGNPGQQGYVPRILYTRWQTAAVDSTCGAAFGGDPRDCPPIYNRLDQLFNRPIRTDAAKVDALCDDLKIDYLVVNRDDTVWKVAETWVWRRPTVYADEAVRVFPCGKSAKVTAAAR